jgi:membrane-associated protease RseP (regulator of RpoE activity)
MKPRNHCFAVSIVATALCAACVDVRQVAPGPDSLLPSVREVAATAGDAKPFSGLRLESRLAGSLMDLEFAPGVDVMEVTAGSPAEAVGIRVGDKVTKIDGATLDSVEQFEARLAVAAREAGGVVQLEVERDGGVVEVTLKPILRGGADEWKPARFAERLKARLVLATVPLAEYEFGCEVVELLRGSPCANDLRPGSLIVALDGVPARDARELAQRLGALEFGSEFTLTIHDPDGPREIECEAYSPPRTITRLSIPILFGYERDVERDLVSFSFVDLYLFALFSREREGVRVRYDLLWFTVFESGVGELRDEDDEGSEP